MAALATVLEILQLIFAAAVGAGFYSLWTAHRYIKARTFDPQYNQLYVVRFVLGIVAGTILGYSMSSFFNGQSESIAAELSPSLLAIVGGYAADAVAQILQRIADTLVTIVKGNDKDSIEKERTELRSQNQEEKLRNQLESLNRKIKEKNKLMAKLQKVNEELAAGNSPRKALDEMMEMLREEVK